LINKKFKGSAIFLFIAMIPMAIPAVGAAAIWKTGLTAHGWMNSLLYYLAGNTIDDDNLTCRITKFI
jgi:ABC-type sugar transport system permease subunit